MDKNILIQKIRNYMFQNKIDSLLINTCDEFLLEYTSLDNCARFLVTGFSGSTGDVLLTQDKLYLFADGRYHIQADNETDKNVVDVVKLKSGERFSTALIERVKKNETLGIVASKVSLNFFNVIKALADEKNIKIVLLNEDIVMTLSGKQSSTRKNILREIPKEITGVERKEKIKNLQKSLDNKTSVLFTAPEDVAYMTNLRGDYIEFSSSFKGYFLVSNNSCYLFTDDAVKSYEEFEVLPIDKFKEFLEDWAKKYTVIFEKNSINLEIFNLIKNNSKPMSVYEGENFFNKKSIKNECELNHYKEIYKKTDEVVEIINDLVNSEKVFSEYELAKIVEEEFLKRGATSLSFKTILAFGENSALIHYTQNSKERFIKDGDFVLLDCGAYFEGGYGTDITRTFVKGQPTKEQKTLYTTVLRGFIAGYLTTWSNKLTGAEIDKKARDVLDSLSDEGFSFPHSTGHGVGICIHEAPPVLSYSKLGENSLLKEGMIFSIEPGLYKKDFGGVRIENIVCVENGKINTLSKAKFEEKLIDENLLNEEEKIFIKNWNAKC